MNRALEALVIVACGTFGAGVGVVTRAYPGWRWEPWQWAACAVFGAGLGVALAVAALIVASEGPVWAARLRGSAAPLPDEPEVHGREISGVDDLVGAVRSNDGRRS